MTKYEIFENLINSYNNRNDSALSFYCSALLSEEKGNPYTLEYEEGQLFSTLRTNYLRSISGRVGNNYAHKSMIATMKKILDISTMNPYSEDFFTKREQSKVVREVEETKETEENKEQAKEEDKAADIIYIIELMAAAHNNNDKTTFEQDAIHLADVHSENPYHNNTPKYEVYNKLMNAKSKREILRAAEEMCNIINGKKKTILGVLPKKKKEGK